MKTLMETQTNPYESPVAIADPVDVEALTSPEVKQTTLASALMRWSGICIVGAAPSFFLGLAVTDANPICVVAMLLGVAAFIVAYAYTDIRPFWRRWMSQPLIRGSIITAYAIRCVISVIVPVGIANDMIFGMMSIFAFDTFTTPDLFGGAEGMGPLLTFAVTIVQGLLLNAEIAAVGLVIYGLSVLVDRVRKQS